MSASTEAIAQDHVIELGGYVGAVILSDDNELYDPAATEFVRPNAANAELGLRAGYFPILHAGLELEGGFAPTSDGEQSALIPVFRGSAVGRLSLGPISPFLAIGAGTMGISWSDDRFGSDFDPAFHWGLGAKWSISEMLGVRLDARHIVSQAINEGADSARTSHFELLVGASFDIALGSRPKVVEPEPSVAAPIAVAPPPPFGDEPASEPEEKLKPMTDEPVGLPPPSTLTHDEPEPPPPPPPVEPPPTPTSAAGSKCADEAGLSCAANMFKGVEGIEFESGRANLTKPSTKILDQAVSVLTAFPRVRIEVAGFTDDRGPDQTNLELSQMRAESVRAYIVFKGGIDADRVVAKGYGEADPVASNSTREGRKRNRRIEFKLLK